MTETGLLVLTVIAALGCGLIGGVFFAFSNFVMRALDSRPPVEAIAAMQAINLVVLNPTFLGTFLGTGAVSIGALALSVTQWRYPEVGLHVAACALYVAGTIGVTVLANVPRNDALASVRPEDPKREERWKSYVREWTRWNHVRTVASLTASALYTLSLVL